MKRLPIGLQAFEVLRTQGYVYVDKTRDVYRMVDEGMFYFLSRPRRFGKSLLVSTFKCLFEGKKELFTGLWIGEHGDWNWRSYPVILLDFNGIAHETSESLELALHLALNKTARAYQVDLETPLLVSRFGELIVALHQKTGQPVVVLMDEYDKPLIDHLGQGAAALETAKANREILRRFFGVLKDGDIAPRLRFVFITGVSRFSRVSVFSELNNLHDLSMNGQYAEMLGYTPLELDACFGDHLERFARESGRTVAEIKTGLAQHYNGYRFSERDVTVYNPFSILNALSDRDFKHYWFETGTPTFLINLLLENRYDLPQIEALEVDRAIFTTFELDALNPEALLFQTGYLTIQNVHEGIYTLGYPNQEVKTSFLKSLLFTVETIKRQTSSQIVRLGRYLEQKDYPAFFESIQAVFASIPYDIGAHRDEAYFHTLFYLMLSASSDNAQSSVLTSRGRIDMVITYPHQVFLIEFKCNQSAAAALRQIQEKGYAEKYRHSGKQIVCLGINFNTEQRNVTEWQVA